MKEKSSGENDKAKELYEAMLTLKNTDEFAYFFRNICTTKEVHAMAQRYQVAEMLYEGKTYQEIVMATGASTATVSRIKRSMEDQGREGYDIVFERLKKK